MIASTFLRTARDQLIQLASIRRFVPAEHVEQRIVLVRPDHFGDLLMLTPAIEHLQDLAPDHRVTLMIGPWNQSIASHIAPDVDLIIHDFPGFNREATPGSKLEPYRQIARAATVLRTVSPRAVVLMRDDHWWGAIAAREAGVPLRIGYENQRHNALLTHPLRINHKHYVQQNMELVRSTAAMLGIDIGPTPTQQAIGPLRWPKHTEAARSALKLLSDHGIVGPFIAIHPGTGANVKRWPVTRWVALINQLASLSDRSIVMTGSPDEFGLCDTIARNAQATVTNLAGATSLFELGEVFRTADLVIGVDSGPLHLATATGTASIHLYGPSDAVRYGPWGDSERHRTISAGMSCPDCGNLSPDRSESCGCMTGITVRDVLQDCSELLGAHD